MSVINKHVEKAERFLQKGKMEAALEEYLLAWKEEPTNDTLVHLVADLYFRLSRFEEGRKCYTYLFDKYAENNDVTKATEAFRKVQRLGPVDPARLIRFAQLMEKVKPKEAVEHYRLALDAVVGQNSEMALQCLRGLANLEPSSVEIQARMAAVALKVGKTDLAAASYHKVGLLRMAEGRFAEAVEALEEAFRLPGSPPTVRMDLARACAKAGRFGRVISVLEDPRGLSDQREVLELLGEAYLAEKRFDQAEKVYQNLLETSVAAVGPLVTVAMEYISRGSVPQGLRTLKAIEQQLTISRRQEVLTAFAQRLSQFDHTHIPVLEYTAHLLDRLHLDSPLTKTLNQLFALYVSAGDYSKAGEALEQLIAIDIYAPECAEKLDQLEGKLEPALWNELAGRMGRAPKPAEGREASPSSAGEAPSSEPAAGPPAEDGAGLRDLVLQAEIFLQYNLKDKALERLERIAKLFPHEDERNEDVRMLFERAGYTPPYEPAPLAPSAISPPEPQDMRSYVSRVTEVSRNLSRQGTVKGVLSTAVNDIGRQWQASRCMVGVLAPNRPPSMALEYISPGIQPSDPILIGKLLMSLQQMVLEQGSTLVVEQVARAPKLLSLQNFLKTLQVESLAAVLLREEGQPMGLLVLEQCGGPRAWKANELAGLEALAEQIVLTVTNVRLRNLMRTLAVTDERSGLLHRDSYIPCLLSEAERMQTQQKPLTGALLRFSPGDRKPAEKQPLQAPEEFIQSVSGTIVAHLRQNDIAVRYGPRALALILPGTAGKEAVTVVEKLRRLVTATAAGDPTKTGPPCMAAFIGEAVQERGMENVDVVTELINRLEMAVESALPGDASTRLLDPSPFRPS